ncbi:hypothetical protein KDK95_22005 [Actinospica sp. MGRD01-02]|uniref:Uncharacterized protein n=1 Tax=Actinospica acidithermotolerans TaxID=2828514 RepID=A0A941EE54_9ACTN|nr:hypothetical protein [Actinospica acidithermotolerans]MBR7828998.1 hypothetical protein [Actinospica acidithermotolerans]
MADLKWAPAIHVKLAKGYEVRDVDGKSHAELKDVKVALDNGFIHIDSGLGADNSTLIDVRPASAVLSLAYERHRPVPGMAWV